MQIDSNEILKYLDYCEKKWKKAKKEWKDNPFVESYYRGHVSAVQGLRLQIFQVVTENLK